MDSETAAWLRQQREDRGWPKAEMARRLVQAGREAGDTAVPELSGMLHNIHRWEREGGISERHKLHYCRALGIHPSQFGLSTGEPARGRSAGPAPPRPALPSWYPPSTQPSSPRPPARPCRRPAAVAYRGRQEPVLRDFAVEHEVMMAAHEGSDHAAEHEHHGIGEATLEQLRADLARLSGLCDTGAPLPAFLDMRQVRDRIYRLLDRRARPRDEAELYFLLGCLHELMGLTANRLGYPDAAEELLRAGWAYANVIDHNALRGMVRARLSYVMYWRGRYADSRDLAADGLRYASRGLVGANLHLEQARALARLGEPDAARQQVGLAHAAWEDRQPRRPGRDRRRGVRPVAGCHLLHGRQRARRDRPRARGSRGTGTRHPPLRRGAAPRRAPRGRRAGAGPHRPGHGPAAVRGAGRRSGGTGAGPGPAARPAAGHADRPAGARPP